MGDYSTEKLVLSKYGINSSSIKPIGSGLINHTWLVTDQENKYILQRVNPMFKEEIHDDIDKVTTYLCDSGLDVPRLVSNESGKVFCNVNDNVWRLYRYIEGITFDVASNPQIACEAGVLLGEFHRHLNYLEYKFKYIRPGVHDTSRHLQVLEDALKNNVDHIRYQEAKGLGTEILDLASKIPQLPATEIRKVHGDPKINNFLFDKNTGKGICLLDFDTLSNMNIILELGDAMRSWCNPCGEDEPNSTFLLENFQAGLEGYRTGSAEFITGPEWEGILPATVTIYIELSARFCADALNEDYFAWDPDRYTSHSEHSLIRAQSQLKAGKSLLDQYKAALTILKQLH